MIGHIPAAYQTTREVPAVAPGIPLDHLSDSPVDMEPARHWKAVASGGSSGRPKLIVDNMAASVDPAAPFFMGFGLPTEGAMLNPGPLYHNMPFLFSSLGLMAGAHVVGMARFDPEECLRLIEKHRVEFVAFVPTMMQRICTLPESVRSAYDISSLRTLWHMAAPCPHWVKRAWIDWIGADRVFEGYGGTEGAGSIFITGQEWLAKPGSVGRAAIGNLRILREDGEEADVGEVGEVHFPSAGTDKFAYVGADRKVSASGEFSLGDLGYIDEDGYLFLADRRSDLILRGGANVYPAEIESALDEHPMISTSVAIGLPDDDLGERVHVIIHLREGAQLDLAALAAHLAERLAKYKWPASYELSDAPLRDEAGKIRRSAFKAERCTWIEEGRAFELRP